MTKIQHSDYAGDELSEDWSGSDEGHVSVAFIAVLPLLFGAFMIGLAFWVLR